MNTKDIVIKITKAFFILAALCTVFASLKYAHGRFLNEFHYAGVFDWPFFVEAAKHFISVGKIYEDNLDNFYPSAPIYKFPPFFISIIVYLMENGISEESIRYGFGVLHIGIYIFCAILLGISCANENKWLFSAFIIIFIFTFEPFVINIYRLQPEIFVLFFVSTAALLISKQKNTLAGACIGFAALIKVYPAFFAIYFIFQNRLRFFTGMMVAMVIGSLFSLGIVGYSEHVRYLIEILPILLKEKIYLSMENISLGAVLMGFSLPHGLAAFAGNAVLLSGILVLATGYLKVAREVWHQNETVWLAFSILVSSFVLGAKNSWWNYQLLLVFPIMVGMGISISQKYKDIVSACLILLACVLIYAMNPARLAPIFNFVYEPVIPGFLASVLIMTSSMRLFWRVIRKTT